MITLSGEDLLKIKFPGDIFEKDEKKIKTLYKELSFRYHPDSADVSMGEDNTEIFSHLTDLYNKAIELINNDEWEKTGYKEIKNVSGKKIMFKYYTDYPFELGHIYVTETKVIYIIAEDKKKYKDRYLETVKSISYKTSEIESEFKRLMPDVYSEFEAADGSYVIILNKDKDIYPLKIVADYYLKAGKMDPRHVAWIMSRLSNLCCFFETENLVINGIDVNSIFINPREHLIYLYGGFFYATRENERMVGTTKEIFELMSAKAKSEKISKVMTDLESVKYIGRYLLGDTNCRTLMEDMEIPKSIREFLITGSGNDSYLEFSKWDKALIAGFGERKFIVMDFKI